MTVLCQDIGDGWCVRTSVTFRGVLRGRPPRVARVAGSWWETYLVPGCGHGYWVRTSPWGSVMVILWASQVIRASWPARELEME